MRGEFDHQLKWPFDGSLNITLLDQEGDQHWSVDIYSYDEETPQSNCGQVFGEGENEGWGGCTFIALHPKYYKISDSLIFKVSPNIKNLLYVHLASYFHCSVTYTM